MITFLSTKVTNFAIKIFNLKHIKKTAKKMGSKAQ